MSYLLHPVTTLSGTLQHHAAWKNFLGGLENTITTSLCINNSKTQNLRLEGGVRRGGKLLGGKAVSNKAGAVMQREIKQKYAAKARG